jgi:hypothetical protein
MRQFTILLSITLTLATGLLLRSGRTAPAESRSVYSSYCHSVHNSFLDDAVETFFWPEYRVGGRLVFDNPWERCDISIYGSGNYAKLHASIDVLKIGANHRAAEGC